MAKKRKPQPLAPPPQSSALRSRKRARQVTTLFHKYTTERDAAIARAQKAGCCTDNLVVDDAGTNNCSNNNLSSHQIQLLAEVKKWDVKLSEIGGREEYQRASQMNTSLFSTSKWVLGIVGKWGWLDGLPISITSDHCGKDDNDDDKAGNLDNHKKKEDKKKGKIQRRDVRLLEIGAINTQLLDASERTRIKTNHNNDQINNERLDNDKTTERVYHLDVKAIDIRSTDKRIQQLNFFDLPLPNKVDIKDDTSSDTTSVNKQQQQHQQQHYDVIVNSMVINCVTTPAQRGQMLSLCYQHLRPGGVLFLTLPKLCLIQSKSMSRSYFEEILTKGVGFEILKEVGRESPKIAFFVLRRPKKEKAREIKEDDKDQKSRTDENNSFDDKFTRMPVIHRGKKFRNTFAVTLNEEDCVK